jgi:hypothetical protein
LKALFGRSVTRHQPSESLTLGVLYIRPGIRQVIIGTKFIFSYLFNAFGTFIPESKKPMFKSWNGLQLRNIMSVTKTCQKVKWHSYTYQFITVTLFGGGNGIPHEIASFTRI